MQHNGWVQTVPLLIWKELNGYFNNLHLQQHLGKSLFLEHFHLFSFVICVHGRLNKKISGFKRKKKTRMEMYSALVLFLPVEGNICWSFVTSACILIRLILFYNSVIWVWRIVWIFTNVQRLLQILSFHRLVSCCWRKRRPIHCFKFCHEAIGEKLSSNFWF